MSQTCATCGASVEDPMQTGMICARCYEEQHRPVESGWRAYVPAVAVPGAIAAAVGAVFSLSFTVGLRTLDVVALPCALIALASGGAGTVSALRGTRTKLAGAAVVVLAGLYLLVRSGVLGWLG